MSPPSRLETDFPDWLSPILVKELRQGLKTKAFVGIFILVQATMILVTGLRLLVTTTRDQGFEVEMFEFLFWVVVWLPLLFIMPARGLTAISTETRSNTFDLVQLTRMTTFRIVLGKWVALVAQTLLLVAAIMPYLVLRYFFGKVDIVTDLAMLAGFLQGSLVLTAFAVMLSSTSLVVRIVVLVFGFPLGMSALSGVNAFLMFKSSGLSIAGGVFNNQLFMWLSGLLTSAASVYFLLEMATGRLAPLSENHSGRRRALILCMLLLMVIIALFGRRFNESQAFLWMGLLPMIAWSAIETICERTVTVPTLYRPFAKRGFIGRLLGRFFYPGWATGVLYISTLWLIGQSAYLLNAFIYPPSDDELYLYAIASFCILTGIILPVFAVSKYSKPQYSIGIYFVIQGAMILIYIVGAIISSGSHSASNETVGLLLFLPLCAGIAVLTNNDSNKDLMTLAFYIILPVCGMVWIFLFNMIRKEFKVIRQMEKESLDVVSSDRSMI